MIYLIYGSDRDKSRERVHFLVEGLLKKKPGASFFRINIDNWSTSLFEELLESQGLFEQKYVVVLDHLLEDKEAQEVIIKNLKEAKESVHPFILLEEKLSASDLKKLEKYANKVQSFEEKRGTLKKDFNIFSFSDALTSRNTKKLWTLFLEAQKKGLLIEEIHGNLLWQTKMMLLVSESKTASEAGMKPFVFNKAKKGLEKFKKEELKEMHKKLFSIYHDSRRGLLDFDIALEKFILEM